MLPEAAAHMEQLQAICEERAQQLAALAREWEKHRRPLVTQHRRIKEERARRKEAAKQKVEDMKRMRAEMKAMATDVRAKEARLKVLAEEYDRMPKNVNRSVYTLRIMDIIKQVRKQKAEIRKIIADVRDVQKSINAVGEKLHRTESITDERVYKLASESKSDPAYVAAYRNLSELRSRFEQLVKTVEDSGRADSAIRDLEARVEALNSRNTSHNTERILRDLAQVRRENKEIVAKIKRARAAAKAGAS
eukprot:PLAT1590.2.p2 GENE.PLAT1590.2~~PLAT1590.2.p2  ORF type:complete len:249 (-),score=149.05 PLAT1590.2:136-882(-)